MKRRMNAQKISKGMKCPRIACVKDHQTDAIFCSNCNRWVHAQYEKLSDNTFKQLKKIDTGYICRLCCYWSTTNDHVEDFDHQSLAHLTTSVSDECMSLKTTTNMQSIHTRDNVKASRKMPTSDKKSVLRIDCCSQNILQKCNMSQGSPDNVVADNNRRFHENFKITGLSDLKKPPSHAKSSDVIVEQVWNDFLPCSSAQVKIEDKLNFNDSGLRTNEVTSNPNDLIQHMPRGQPKSTECRLLSSHFLDVDELCTILNRSDTPLMAIPLGLKENVYFVVGNEKNMHKRSNGGRSNFADDCGVWSSKASSTKKTIFFHNGASFRHVELKGDNYCTRIKGQWVPLEPQPAVEDIVIIKRYYATLKRKDDFKKRVTWIDKPSSKMSVSCINKAVVEYIGIFPDSMSIHGNSKKTENEYIRSLYTTKQMKKVKRWQTTGVYSVPMIMEADDSLNVPWNVWQVQNMKHRTIRDGNKMGERTQIAEDCFLTAINKLDGHPVIEVTKQEHELPNVIVTVQMTD